ncbi:MAG TPA: hypothetical protein VFZ53_18745 [Polyangiaceae bacterium]
MNTMSARLLNLGAQDVLLNLHTSHAPARAEWDQSMGQAKQYARQQDLRNLRILVVTDGGGPDAVMRAEVAEFYKANRVLVKTAVITASLISRSIVAAIGLVNPHVKAFSPGHVRTALTHLDLPPTHASRIVRELDDMQRDLPSVACLTVLKGLATTASA